ncbi:GRIP and coiled-coil domain-containing protein 2 [Diorhabda sublineata]|uniref:GRIP and coiled-coil domain-containing protein 2 n=1 Tax=Diorhabda sublineata TaxID=1163346 RepID=UPI0024E0DF26|nr:GRIP and coiled-coil domain-containing protein 2 [Diorhabda sublineata]
MESSASTDVNKKFNLENLTKEELIKKCTQLLQLAQKAKQSKTALQEENNKLKEELNSKNDNSNTDHALQEVIEKLTEQKLNLVTENQELKTQNELFNKRIKEYESELKSFEEKYNVCDNENTSYKRQIKRLTDENDQLILNLDTLEKQLNTFQKNNHVEKEPSINTTNKEIGEINELNSLLNLSKEDVQYLKIENNRLVDRIENLQINLEEKNKNIIIISKELELTKDNCTMKDQDINTLNSKLQEMLLNKQELVDSNVKLKQKIKFYHSKVVKFAGIVKELRENKNEVLDLFKSSIEQVKEWKEQLNYGEKNIIKYLNNVAMENQNLRQQIEQQKENEHEAKILADQLKSEKMIIEEELSEAKENIKILSFELEELRKNNTDDNNESFEEEKNTLLIKLDEIQSMNSKLETDKLILENQLMESKEIIVQCNNKIDELNQNVLDLTEGKQRIEGDQNPSKLEEENANLSTKLQYLQNELSQNMDDYRIKCDTLNFHIEEQSQTQRKLTNTIHELENEVKLLRKENCTISKVKEELSEELNRANTERKALNEKIGKNVIAEEMFKGSEKRIQDLQSQIKSFEELEKRSTEEIKNLAEENKRLMSENNTLEEKLGKLEYSLINRVDSSCQTNEVPFNNSDEFKEQITNLKRENSELLLEMNEMNQAIKERGETISKLEAHCEEIMKKLQIYETQANQNIDNLTEKDKIIENLTSEIEELKQNANSVEATEIITLQNQIEILKEKLCSTLDSSLPDNDAMSSSTISRTEDLNRLKDLEGSWEEKYGKLRNLAIKLKGKVRELTQTVAKEQSDNEEAQKKLISNMKTIQNFQNQCDKLEDDLEKCKLECKQLQSQLNIAAVDISRDKQLLAEKDELVSSLKMEIENNKKDKQTTENWKKQVSAKIQTLRKELEANNVLKKEYEAKISNLNSTLEDKDQALKTEIESHKHTKILLEQSNNERKKNSVLSLEMQDYERSVKESAKKIEKQQEEITKLNNQIESQKTTINALREQNKLFEERLNTEEQNVITVTTEINTYKKQIASLDNEITQKKEKIQILTQHLETARSEIEELSTELGKVIAEHQKANSVLKSERDQLSNDNLKLQQDLRETQDNLRLIKEELRIIQDEYDCYKVRAQSVLRQNQNRDIGLEEKLSEKVTSLAAQNQALTQQLNDSLKKIECLKNENIDYSTQIEDITNKVKEIKEEYEELQTQYAELSGKHEKTVLDNAETLRNLKVRAETLTQCYRQQLADQEARHEQEILELRSQLEKAPTPTDNYPALPTMPRGEGEGSESVESNASRGVHPIPLERLLGTDSDEEIERIKLKLKEHESKVTHLTALLSDTEQDLVKHIQMNKLLKEEIRRHQRSEEREKHAENLEYLKNVVFKFITLNSGDERSRLVPVMNTILKLSPEEAKQLNSVAKGDISIKGWSSYLPTWPSPNKS